MQLRSILRAGLMLAGFAAAQAARPIEIIVPR
jgi:hypothetical protein